MMKLKNYIKKLQELEALHGGDLECVRTIEIGTKLLSVADCDTRQEKIYGCKQIIYV